MAPNKLVVYNVIGLCETNVKHNMKYDDSGNSENINFSPRSGQALSQLNQINALSWATRLKGAP